MTVGTTLDEDLAATMARALLPPRFPARRDLELESAICADSATLSYFDYFWRSAQVIFVTAIRIHQPGLDGAWTACGMRALLRALVTHFDTPAEALEALRARIGNTDFDAALLELDTLSGMACSALRGRANVEQAGSHDFVSGNQLGVGDILWVTAGAMAPLGSEKMAVEGLESLVRPALQQSESGAGTALIYKLRARSRGTATFIMGNDLGAIPALLGDLAKFLHQQSVDETTAPGLEVALDEILTNVVSYGYRDGHAHEVMVTLRVEKELLTIEISDDGAPFDPLTVPEPDLSADIEHRHIGGLGMHFVRTLLDRLAYKRSNGWNILTLEKRLMEQVEAQ